MKRSAMDNHMGLFLSMAFPDGTVVKILPANAGDTKTWVLIPWVRKNPLEKELAFSWENPKDRGASQRTVHVTHMHTHIPDQNRLDSPNLRPSMLGRAMTRIPLRRQCQLLPDKARVPFCGPISSDLSPLPLPHRLPVPLYLKQLYCLSPVLDQPNCLFLLVPGPGLRDNRLSSIMFIW